MPTSDKKHIILQAAEKVFTNRRFHEITLDEVAQSAKVGKGTIYQYFADKDDLFFQVTTSGFDELCALLRQRVRESAPFAEQLLDACTQVSSFFEKRRQLFRMMQSEDARMTWEHGAMREQWMEKRRGLVDAVAAIIRKGVTERQIRADVAPEVLAGFLLGMLRTRARDLHSAEEAVRRHELLIDLFLNGASPSSRVGASCVASDPQRS